MKKIMSLLALTLVLGMFAIGCAKKSDKPAAPAAPAGGGAAAPAGGEAAPAKDAAKP